MTKLAVVSTRQAVKYIKVLIFGKYGIGKTPLAATAPNPVIIDSERGTLSLGMQDLPKIEVNTFDDLMEAYEIIKSKRGKVWETVVLDSGSEIAEKVLQHLKDEQGTKMDKRAAYFELEEKTLKVFRKFMQLDKHLIVTAKLKVAELDGTEKYRASFPGKALVEKVPYLFDEVFCLRFNEEDATKESEEDEIYKVLQTQPDDDYDAKDRSCQLKKFEKPDMTYIFNKIISGMGKEAGKGKKNKNKKEK